MSFNRSTETYIPLFLSPSWNTFSQQFRHQSYWTSIRLWLCHRQNSFMCFHLFMANSLCLFLIRVCFYTLLLSLLRLSNNALLLLFHFRCVRYVFVVFFFLFLSMFETRSLQHSPQGKNRTFYSVKSVPLKPPKYLIWNPCPILSRLKRYQNSNIVDNFVACDIFSLFLSFSQLLPDCLISSLEVSLKTNGQRWDECILSYHLHTSRATPIVLGLRERGHIPPPPDLRDFLVLAHLYSASGNHTPK